MIYTYSHTEPQSVKGYCLLYIKLIVASKYEDKTRTSTNRALTYKENVDKPAPHKPSTNRVPINTLPLQYLHWYIFSCRHRALSLEAHLRFVSKDLVSILSYIYQTSNNNNLVLLFVIVQTKSDH